MERVGRWRDAAARPGQDLVVAHVHELLDDRPVLAQVLREKAALSVTATHTQ
jgi:hypothetical protein